MRSTSPSAGRSFEERLHVGAAAADDHDRQTGQQTRGDRKAAEDPEPQPRERQDEDRNERADPDDDRRPDHVGEPLERDRRGRFARIDPIVQQDDLQRFARDAPQRQVAERLGRAAARARDAGRTPGAAAESTTTRPTCAPGARGR